MVDIAKISYRNRKYKLIALIGVFLWFFIFSLQSCSLATNKLGVNYISANDLEQDRRRYRNGVFPRELANNIGRLEAEGFVAINAQNDAVNVRKHLIIVFYHCLRLKHESIVNNVNMTQSILNFFGNNGVNPNPAAAGLMFLARQVDINNVASPIKFVFTHLLTQNDPNIINNQIRVNASTAPFVRLDNQSCLALNNGIDRKLEVDHLLKDNTVTIELPASVHRLKTSYLCR